MARMLVLVLTAIALLVSRDTLACKRSGDQCQTTASCCTGECVKPTVKRGNAVFGICCTPTTCAAAGAGCGTIPDGNCAGFTLDCGTCPAPATCGGGGTPNVCGTTTTTSTTTSTTTTIVYPQSNALDGPLEDVLASFGSCVSTYVDDTMAECGGQDLECCGLIDFCKGEDHYQGLARTPSLHDGSFYWFLSHSGVDGGTDTGRLTVYRYPGPLDGDHAAGPGVTAAETDRVSLADETHPSDIDFLPDVNHSESGYLFVAKEFVAKVVSVYYWQPGQPLHWIKDLVPGLTKPSHIAIDRYDDGYYYLVVFDTSFGNGTAFRAYETDLFPSGTPGSINLSAFEVLPYFTFTPNTLGSQVQLIRDPSSWYLLVYDSDADDGNGNDFIHVHSITLGSTVSFGPEVPWSPVHFILPAGTTSFTTTGAHWVEPGGRMLVSSSDRWSQDLDNAFSWESRVDECAPAP